jgi:hypothetical protein
VNVVRVLYNAGRVMSEKLFNMFAVLISCVYFALSVSLVATTDFGEQKSSRDLAIALAVLTGLPSFALVVGLLVLCCGVMSGSIKIWA